MLEVVAALIRREDQVLICRRPPHKARAGCWEFPGGKVESGESLREALVRECREELAVALSVGNVLADTVYAYPDLTIHLSLLEARVEAGTLTPLEHSEIRFVRPESFPEYTFCPADQLFLDRIRGCKKSPEEKAAK